MDNPTYTAKILKYKDGELSVAINADRKFERDLLLEISRQEGHE